MPRKFDYLSPGISLREVDLSVLPAQVQEEGPVIIGRTKYGPAMVPIRINNLSDYITIFGRPVPGGVTLDGDVWRNGNTAGPTYAAYAAQSWLASETSPITVVRLLGQQSPSKIAGGEAGWKVSGSLNVDAPSNGTAYGLWIMNSASSNAAVAGAATEANALVSGTLAAVFYANSGYLQLSGTLAAKNVISGPSDSTGSSGVWITSETGGESNAFKLKVFDNVGDAGTLVETVNINFSRTHYQYLRSVCNTNPQLVNETTVAASSQKSYWLGESYTRNVEQVISGDAGEQWGCLLLLRTGSSMDNNWGVNQSAMAAGESGWVFSQDMGLAADWVPQNQQKLFKTVALQEGTYAQAKIVVSINDLKLPSNPTVNNWSTFTVKVLDFATGQMLEEYTNCNLNPANINYVARKVGNMFQTWDDTANRYRLYGDHPNNSDYIRIVMDDSIDADGPPDTTMMPFGFFGPPIPKPWRLFTNCPNAMNINATALDQNKVHTYVTPAKGSTVVGGSVEPTVYSLWSGDATNVTASYYWPTLQLRKSGSDGYTSNPFKALWGIRPTISANSTFKDPDYGDYLRRFNSANYDNGNGSSLNENVQYSFIFSLDDIVIGTGTDVYHLSGSRVGGTSYSAMSGISELLDKDVRQFVFPLYGGFDGLDITEKEPFNNTVVGESADPAANYTIYTLNKAIDSVSDPDNVGASMMIVPGIWQPSVTNRLINVCENRADSLAIIDIENDYTPKTEDTSSAEDRRGNVNSAVSAMKTRNFNTSYACCFYPWVQVTDNLNSGERVWVPSSIAGLGAMAQTQARSELWFAPAGFNRGGLGNLGGMQGPRVVQARQRLDQSERDKLYDANINPIATFPNEGVVIFGQKTLQATPSALDRINVRRLMLYLKSQVGHIARNLLFDQNVTSTWARFKGKVEPILADVQSRFGITEYKLVLDETTTTDDLIDRNIMYAKIFLKPARAIEYIVVDFVITRTGAEFT